MPRDTKRISQALDTLVFIAEEVGWIFSRKGGFSGIGYTHDTWSALQAEREYYWKKAEARRHWHYLQEQKLIASRRVGERLEVQLTDKGWCALLKELIRRADEDEQGKMCIIMYDVPQSEKVLRQMLQRFLKYCGFTRLQKSVWMTRKDVSHLFRAFVVESRLGEWIQIIEGTMVQ